MNHRLAEQCEACIVILNEVKHLAGLPPHYQILHCVQNDMGGGRMTWGGQNDLGLFSEELTIVEPSPRPPWIPASAGMTVWWACLLFFEE